MRRDEPKQIDENEAAQQMQDRLKRIGKQEGGPMWFGKPDRWYESPRWRCTNGHVSRWYVMTDGRGDRCPVCGALVGVTFPEDKDGPLPDG